MSVPTSINSTNNQAISFTTNLVIVGGAYAGLSAINTFVNQFKHKTNNGTLGPYNENQRFSVTLIEPRAGLLNVLGMPRCIVDSEFSQTQYIPFDRLNNLKFDSIVSCHQEVLDQLNKGEDSENHHCGLDVNYIHGKVTYLDQHKAQYCLSDDKDYGEVKFDYVILASGRDRKWPTTPKAITSESFIEEMLQSMEKIDSHEIVTVVGAGAVGIELAGDIKHYRPNKTVNLIHPHAQFPPEILSPEFKALALKSIENAGVNIFLNTRIKHSANEGVDIGTTHGDLTTVDNKVIKSNLNIWCTDHRNNTYFLNQSLCDKFVTAKNDVRVNEYLQLSDEDTTINNFFVLGDLVNLPIIKSAGWALYHGRQVANNITSLILENKLVEPSPDLTQVPKGMVLVGGNGDLICELAGDVNMNIPEYVEEYKDYCFGRIRATIDV